jgi:hypothetical protein
LGPFIALVAATGTLVAISTFHDSVAACKLVAKLDIATTTSTEASVKNPKVTNTMVIKPVVLLVLLSFYQIQTSFKFNFFFY